MIEMFELPIFPLSVLPIPNERIPLHIFEPRYKQLLEDVEKDKLKFGIYYSHGLNKDRLGGIVELEAITRHYEKGESDIIVKCVDTFILTRFYNKMLPKLYPGGLVVPLHATNKSKVTGRFESEFNEYLTLQGINNLSHFDIHDVANELSLDIGDRLKYLQLLDIRKREVFLRERLRYRKFILEQELKVKGNFFLN